MLTILLLYFLLFPPQIFAIPSVVINSVPDVITAGTTFPITFTINEASNSATYYYKFFGGIGSDVYAIKNDPSLSYTSAWVNFPQITLNPGSSNIFNGYAFINPDATTNNFNLKIKIALITNTSNGFTSPSFPIDVVAIPPTPIPTPTDMPIPTNTLTLTPTKNPTPTHTPTPTPISIPTIKPTATPTEIMPTPTEEISTDIPTDTLTPTSTQISGEILGETTTKKQNFIPLIFICLGGLFLLAPLILAKIKSKPYVKKDN